MPAVMPQPREMIDLTASADLTCISDPPVAHMLCPCVIPSQPLG
jgi:hypothetical protein